MKYKSTTDSKPQKDSACPPAVPFCHRGDDRYTEMLEETPKRISTWHDLIDSDRESRRKPPKP